MTFYLYEDFARNYIMVYLVLHLNQYSMNTYIIQTYVLKVLKKCQIFHYSVISLSTYLCKCLVFILETRCIHREVKRKNYLCIMLSK